MTPPEVCDHFWIDKARAHACILDARHEGNCKCQCGAYREHSEKEGA
jgi:hypothetical protein